MLPSSINWLNYVYIHVIRIEMMTIFEWDIIIFDTYVLTVGLHAIKTKITDELNGWHFLFLGTIV